VAALAEAARGRCAGKLGALVRVALIALARWLSLREQPMRAVD